MFTVRFRPSKSFPWNISIAARASSLEDISTNPNPFDRPVILSMMIWAAVTVPAWPNAARNESSVVEYGNPPTYSFFSSVIFYFDGERIDPPAYNFLIALLRCLSRRDWHVILIIDQNYSLMPRNQQDRLQGKPKHYSLPQDSQIMLPK